MWESFGGYRFLKQVTLKKSEILCDNWTTFTNFVPDYNDSSGIEIKYTDCKIKMLSKTTFHPRVKKDFKYVWLFFREGLISYCHCLLFSNYFITLGKKAKWDLLFI